MPAEGVADHLRQLDKGSPSRRSQTLDVANDAMMEAEPRTRPITGDYLSGRGALASTLRSELRGGGVAAEEPRHIGTGETNACWVRKDTGNRLMRELGRGPHRDGKIEEPPERELRGQLVRLAVEAFVRKRSLAAVSSKSLRSSSPTLRC
jgi:hypothetical protein